MTKSQYLKIAEIIFQQPMTVQQRQALALSVSDIFMKADKTFPVLQFLSTAILEVP